MEQITEQDIALGNTLYESGIFLHSTTGKPARILEDGLEIWKTDAIYKARCVRTLKQTSIPSLGALVIKDVDFVPGAPVDIDEDTINIWRPSDYHIHASLYSETEENFDKIYERLVQETPHIHALLENLIGCNDKKKMQIITVWLSNIVKHRRNRTFLLFNSPTGTGKDLLHNVLLNKLFKYTILTSGKHAVDAFNSMVANKVVIVWDEYFDNSKSRYNAIKHMITAKKTRIEQKGVDAYFINNTANFIFFSNLPSAMKGIDDDERRAFTFDSTNRDKNDAKLRNHPLFKNYDNFSSQIENELNAFVRILAEYKYDKTLYSESTVRDADNWQAAQNNLTDHDILVESLKEKTFEIVTSKERMKLINECLSRNFVTIDDIKTYCVEHRVEYDRTELIRAGLRDARISIDNKTVRGYTFVPAPRLEFVETKSA